LAKPKIKVFWPTKQWQRKKQEKTLLHYLQSDSALPPLIIDFDQL
jgi:hypothetical protein